MLPIVRIALGSASWGLVQGLRQSAPAVSHAIVVRGFSVETDKADKSNGPPTDAQKKYLSTLGYRANEVSHLTFASARAAIDARKPEFDAFFTQHGTGWPTGRQLDFLSKHGYSGPAPTTNKQAAELITKIKAESGTAASPSDSSSVPPSEKQVAFLQTLGHTGPAPATRKEATQLIDTLVAQRDAAGTPRASRPTNPATSKQLELLAKLGYTGPAPTSTVEAAALIDKVTGPNPASPSQLEALTKYGYSGPAPATYGEARKLLDGLSDAVPATDKQIAAIKQLSPDFDESKIAALNKRKAGWLITKLKAPVAATAHA